MQLVSIRSSKTSTLFVSSHCLSHVSVLDCSLYHAFVKCTRRIPADVVLKKKKLINKHVIRSTAVVSKLATSCKLNGMSFGSPPRTSSTSKNWIQKRLNTPQIKIKRSLVNLFYTFVFFLFAVDRISSELCDLEQLESEPRSLNAESGFSVINANACERDL